MQQISLANLQNRTMMLPKESDFKSKEKNYDHVWEKYND